MRGSPHYTQDSVAWPHNTKFPTVVDTVTVSFDALGGGTHGEFMFVWKDLNMGDRKDKPCLQITCFVDGLGAMLDHRLLAVIRNIGKMKAEQRDISPERLLAKLEGVGVKPSRYHLAGLLERGDISWERQKEITREIERQKRYEEGRR